MPSFTSLWGYNTKAAPTTATSRHQSIDVRASASTKTSTRPSTSTSASTSSDKDKDRDWENLSTPTGRRSEEDHSSDADVQSLEGSRTHEDFMAEKRELAELRERCAELKKQNESLGRRMEKYSADNNRLREERAKREVEYKEALRKREEVYREEAKRRAGEYDEELRRRDKEHKEAVGVNNATRATAEDECHKMAEKVVQLKKQHEEDQLRILTLLNEAKAIERQREDIGKHGGELREELKRRASEHREAMRRRDEEHAAELKRRDTEHKEELARRDAAHKAALEEISTTRATAEEELRKQYAERITKYRKRHDDDQAYIATLVDETKTLERRLRDAGDAAHAANDSAGAWQREAERQGQDAKALRDERAHTKKQFDQVLSLLDVRSAELKGAQSFLSIADAATGTQVMDALRRLNGEVMQVAAFLAEATLEKFEFAFGGTSKMLSGAGDAGSGGTAVSAEERTFATQRMGSILGAKMVEHLAGKNHGEEPILLQIAFQAYLARVLEWVVGAWLVGDPTLNSFLDTLYSQVKTTVLGKWRAMTRAHLLASQPDRTRALNHISTTLLDGLAHILLAARCTTPPGDVKRALADKYTHRFALLAGLALDVNRVIGEDVTSSEYEVLAVKSGVVFERGEMEDAYDDGHSHSHSHSHSAGNGSAAKVLCPTDLGLVQRTKLAGGREGRWDVKVLLKPKVALESVVDFMDE
ncbi:hypothetical protein CONPUDRAFT_82793 [Coniophora puteana RWD-64-598 SS2]|uniref:Uncharacterized protein n=1 Tax=Coniophora puteana (strain RWD-64-598) TaxID=741705 RepID=A0A5M3MND6_CONPW|nr:uncharacterized protein CONPUDRAFT_82793 [Coniophora puteana RWD-64-598 SS2]EIW80669.1 hypothetical protein CONPUDRAFT_82793 [Coniophora puteana RWD-64-598 SS2]